MGRREVAHQRARRVELPAREVALGDHSGQVELAQLEVGVGLLLRLVGALGLVERFLARGLEVSLRGFERRAALALIVELGLEGGDATRSWRS